jgi:hypothetical protein
MKKKTKRMPVAEAEAKPSELASKRPQSRVTSLARRGVASWLDGGDKRGPVARRFRDLVALVTSDLGGPTELSEAQRQIIRRIASLAVWCESQEARMADGDEVNINEFQRASNSLRRLCESIGLQRRAKDVTPSLNEYMASKRRQPDDADYEEAEEAVT